MSAKESIRQLKIKTGIVTRCMKDLVYSEKEIAAQRERIAKVRADPEKDEADAKKQEEVLDEYLATPPREQSSLLKGYDELLTLVKMAYEDETLTSTDEFAKAKDALKASGPVLVACDKLEEEDLFREPGEEGDTEEPFNPDE